MNSKSVNSILAYLDNLKLQFVTFQFKHDFYTEIYR